MRVAGLMLGGFRAVGGGGGCGRGVPRPGGDQLARHRGAQAERGARDERRG